MRLKKVLKYAHMVTSETGETCGSESVGIAEEFREKLLQEKDRSGGGISAFEEMLGLKRSTINSIVSGGNTRIPSIEKAERIAHALGWEVYIGPPRTAPAALAARFSDTETLPVRGMAACSVRGWGKVQRESAAPAPAGPAASDAFWVIASGASMRPEGIEHCDWCLISTTAAPRRGIASGSARRMAHHLNA